jgi:hypothetical protein
MRTKHGLMLGLAAVFLAGSAIADSPPPKPVQLELYIYTMLARNDKAVQFGSRTLYGTFTSDSIAFISAEDQMYKLYPSADGWSNQKLVQGKVSRVILKQVLDSPAE